MPLDIIPSNADFETLRQMCRDNFITLNASENKSGALALKSVTVKTAQAVTSASYVPVTSMHLGANTSGGLVAVLVKISCSIPTNQQGYFQLLIDGEEKDSSPVFDDTGINKVNAVLFFCDNLQSGAHTFKVNVKTAGGTLTISQAAGDTSVMHVIELP